MGGRRLAEITLRRPASWCVAAELTLVAASPILLTVWPPPCVGSALFLEIPCATVWAAVAAWLVWAVGAALAVVTLAVITRTVAAGAFVARAVVTLAVAWGVATVITAVIPVATTIAVAVTVAAATPAKPWAVVEHGVWIIQQNHLTFFSFPLFFGNAAAAFFWGFRFAAAEVVAVAMLARGRWRQWGKLAEHKPLKIVGRNLEVD